MALSGGFRGQVLLRLLHALSEPLLIRTAREPDIDAMTGLLGELFAIESDFSSDPRKQREGLLMLLGHESAELLVAEAAGEVVGMCTMQRLLSTAEGGGVGLVEDVVVSAMFRGQGIGSQLLAELERRAAAQGLARLQLLADRENRDALDYYVLRGWQATHLVALRSCF